MLDQDNGTYDVSKTQYSDVIPVLVTVVKNLSKIIGPLYKKPIDFTVLQFKLSAVAVFFCFCFDFVGAAILKS